MSNMTRGATKAADETGITEAQIRKALGLAGDERIGAKHVTEAGALRGEDRTAQTKAAIRFPVKLFELPHPTLEREFIPGKRAIIRTDNNAVLNVVSDKYKLVPHADMLDPVAQAIAEAGILVKEERVSMSMAGAYIRYEWVLDDEATIIKGDKVRWMIVGHNSYNYESRFNLSLAAERLVCFNGLTMPMSLEQLGGKHTTHLDVDGALVQLEKLLDQEKDVVKEWQRWASIKVTHKKFDDLLSGRFKLPGHKLPIVFLEMGKRIVESILSKFDEGESNVWVAFNAITWYATHELQMRKGSDRQAIVQDQFNRKAVQIAQILS